MITAVIIILILISVPKLNDYLSQPKETPPPQKAYVVKSTSPEFNPIWEKESFSMPLPEHDGSIFMVADSEQTYVLSKDGSVVAIDLQNGEEDQIVRMPYKAIPVPFASAIGINSEFLYVGFDGTGKIQGNMTWGAGKVEARDRVSGTPKWSQIIPGATSINSLIITKDTVSVDGNSSSNYYLLNEETGEVLHSEPKLKSSFIWRIENDLIYERTQKSSFQLRNQKQGNILWQSEYFSVAQPPIFTDERIIFKSGAQVFALDKNNGQIVWEYPNSEHPHRLYSNVSSTNDVVFFATEEGVLFAVDVESGKSLGSVQFTPPPIQEPFNDVFYVASGNDIVLVYTGSTEQLFAFRFTSP